MAIGNWFLAIIVGLTCGIIISKIFFFHKLPLWTLGIPFIFYFSVLFLSFIASMVVSICMGIK